MTILSFAKNFELENPLFDEYFGDSTILNIIALNIDGQGTALCRCDGQLKEIDLETVKRIMNGAPKSSIEDYLKSIFDPDFESNSINREAGAPVFRTDELNNLNKYDVANLAKKTLKEMSELSGDHIIYFRERIAQEVGSDTSASLYGNARSNVFHKPDCNIFNSITCTSLFNDSEEAVAAGYKPCKICKP